MSVCNCCGVDSKDISQDGVRIVHNIRTDTCIEITVELGHDRECIHYFEPSWPRYCQPCKEGANTNIEKMKSPLDIPPGSCYNDNEIIQVHFEDEMSSIVVNDLLGYNVDSSKINLNRRVVGETVIYVAEIVDPPIQCVAVWLGCLEAYMAALENNTPFKDRIGRFNITGDSASLIVEAIQRTFKTR